MGAAVRVGLAGAGAVARAVHLPILRRRSDLFTIVAVCDLDLAAARLAAERFGVANVYPTVEEMLASTALDAVMVVHSGSHAATVVSALAADVGVFSEKPLAYTVAEADIIERAADGRPVMVGYMKAYDPAVQRAQAELVGADPRAVEVLVLHPPAALQLAHSELEPVAARTGVGAGVADDGATLSREALGAAAGELGELYVNVLLGSISHDLAVLRTLGIGVDFVLDARRWAGDGGGHLSVAFEGRAASGAGIGARWHFLPRYPTYREEVRVHADDRTVELAFPSPYWLRAPTVLRILRSNGSASEQLVQRSPVEAFEDQLVAFADVLAGRRQPIDGLASARSDIVTCQRIIAAIAHAEQVEIGGEAAASMNVALSE